MNVDTDTMYSAIDELLSQSVSSNGDGSAPCTVNELKRLRDNIAETLKTIVRQFED